MRFVGLVLILIAMAIAYFMGYRQLSFDQARSRVASLFGLPGLSPSPSSAGAAGSSPAATAGAH